MVITGTSGPDNLVGSSGDDQISGLAGDDTLDGGAGNDVLDGGAGHNVYLFGRGDGIDVLVRGNDATPYTGNSLGRLNTLQFKPGVAVADVTASRVGEDLVHSRLR